MRESWCLSEGNIVWKPPSISDRWPACYEISPCFLGSWSRKTAIFNSYVKSPSLSSDCFCGNFLKCQRTINPYSWKVVANLKHFSPPRQWLFLSRGFFQLFAEHGGRAAAAATVPPKTPGGHPWGKISPQKSWVFFRENCRILHVFTLKYDVNMVNKD